MPLSDSYPASEKGFTAAKLEFEGFLIRSWHCQAGITASAQ
ncbi:hypothetical protein CGMCC3_g13967 [Colletotrichum fructicola]|nr:uncharacterized protein CGMCC3_g13967 [Colletotrichum fructicola]KAE9569914.1 hypothetical protein CGMCC3_g13967 [Colletotrichum fructicola]